MLRSDRLKRAAGLMVLSLFSLAGVLLMAEAFHHHDSSTVTNATNTDTSQYVSSASSNLEALRPIASASASIKATFNQRGDEGHGDGEMKSIYFGAFGRPSEGPSSTSVTAVHPAAIASPSSTANPRAATTFKTIFTTTTTSEDPTPLPLIDSVATNMESFVVSLSARVSRLDGETVLPSSFTRSFTGTRPFSIASHGYSEAGIFSTATTSGFRIAPYDPSPSSGEPDEAATVAIAATADIAAAFTSLAAVTAATSSSTSQILLVSYGASISPPTTNYRSPSLNMIPISSTTATTVTSTTSGIQDPAPTSSESQTPHQEGQSLPPSYNPFATTDSAPSGSLTALASVLSSTPIQGVPSTPLGSIVAAISSTVAASVATIVATATSASVSPSLTGPSTQLQSAHPTSSPTSTPLVKPSSDSKEKLTIGLSVCVPLLVAFTVFIVVWLRCRYIEQKRADDLEKDVIWVTPRAHTPRTPTKNRTPRKDRAKGARSAESTPSTLERPDPTFMDGLNDVERAMVEDYQKKVAEVNARRAAHLNKTFATLTRGRGPEKSVQKRSGGPMMQQGLDGASDAPLRRRPSQMFTHHRDSLLNPFIDANEIGHAVSAPSERDNNSRNDNIRNALEYFQPTRLSTITDKSGEIEMPEIPGPFGGAGSGPIKQGGKVKGRLLERFIMKRKGMMPLDG
jgi:hypothetical protein